MRRSSGEQLRRLPFAAPAAAAAALLPFQWASGAANVLAWVPALAGACRQRVRAGACREGGGDVAPAGAAEVASAPAGRLAPAPPPTRRARIFRRRFQPVLVAEPTEQEALAILEGLQVRSRYGCMAWAA